MPHSIATNVHLLLYLVTHISPILYLLPQPFAALICFSFYFTLKHFHMHRCVEIASFRHTDVQLDEYLTTVRCTNECSLQFIQNITYYICFPRYCIFSYEYWLLHLVANNSTATTLCHKFQIIPRKTCLLDWCCN